MSEIATLGLDPLAGRRLIVSPNRWKFCFGVHHAGSDASDPAVTARKLGPIGWARVCHPSILRLESRQQANSPKMHRPGFRTKRHFWSYQIPLGELCDSVFNPRVGNRGIGHETRLAGLGPAA